MGAARKLWNASARHGFKPGNEEVAMHRQKQDQARQEELARARQRSKADDPTRQTTRQVDDNQDDRGRDVNDPARVANEINKTGH
jgi:hypothetical protein